MQRAPRFGGYPAALLLVVTAACETDPAGPDALRAGELLVIPRVISAVDPTLLGVDSIAFSVERLAGERLVDTILAFTVVPEDTIGYLIPLDTPQEEFAVRARALAGSTVLFDADTTLLLDEQLRGTSKIDTVFLTFAGPGRDAVTLQIAPRDSVITWSDTATFTATALDGAGEPVPDAVVVWTTADTGIALEADGTLVAPGSGRDTAYVTARTPGGLVDSTSVRFQPPPVAIFAIRGDGDTSQVGLTVELEVLVIGDDDLGVELVPVRFRAPPGAAVADSVVRTDTAGMAMTVATLGTTPGEFSFLASVPGPLDTIELAVTALPGAPAALAFTAQPSTTEVGEFIFPAVEVSVQDAFGNLVPTATDVITLGLAAGPAGGTLDGFTVAGVDGGVAFFEELFIEQAGDYVLSASAPNLAGAVSDTFQVVQVPVQVVVTPEFLGFLALQDTARFDVTVLDAVENPIVDAVVAWSSSDSTVAAVDGTGLVTAISIGEVEIVALAGTVADTAFVSVDQEPAAIVVSPQTAAFTALGDSIQLSATVTDSNGFQLIDPFVEWSSTNLAIATVDTTGLVLLSEEGGVVQIIATSGLVADTATITVDQVVTSVTIFPGDTTVFDVGVDIQFFADPEDANGFLVIDATVTWSSSDTTVATVDATGLVISEGEGTANIVAAAEGVADTVVVTVSFAPPSPPVDESVGPRPSAPVDGEGRIPPTSRPAQASTVPLQADASRGVGRSQGTNAHVLRPALGVIPWRDDPTAQPLDRSTAQSLNRPSSVFPFLSTPA